MSSSSGVRGSHVGKSLSCIMKIDDVCPSPTVQLDYMLQLQRYNLSIKTVGMLEVTVSCPSHDIQNLNLHGDCP